MKIFQQGKQNTLLIRNQNAPVKPIHQKKKTKEHYINMNKIMILQYRGLVWSEIENIVHESSPQHQEQN